MKYITKSKMTVTNELKIHKICQLILNRNGCLLKARRLKRLCSSDLGKVEPSMVWLYRGGEKMKTLKIAGLLVNRWLTKMASKINHSEIIQDVHCEVEMSLSYIVLLLKLD